MKQRFSPFTIDPSEILGTGTGGLHVTMASDGMGDRH